MINLDIVTNVSVGIDIDTYMKRFTTAIVSHDMDSEKSYSLLSES